MHILKGTAYSLYRVVMNEIECSHLHVVIGMVPKMHRAQKMLGNVVFMKTVSVNISEMRSGSLLTNFCVQYISQMSISDLRHSKSSRSSL